MPATPDVVGAYLAAAGEGYAMPTLRRRLPACGIAGHPLESDGAFGGRRSEYGTFFYRHRSGSYP